MVAISPQTGLLSYDGVYPLRYKVYNKTKIFTIPSFGFNYSLKNLNFSFGVFIPFGLGASYDLYDYPVGFESNYEYPKYDFESDLKVIASFLGLSKTFGKLRVGFSFGPYYSAIMFRNLHLVTVDSSLPVEYAQFPLDQKMEGSGYGFGGVIGAFYPFNDKFALGFSFKGYTKAKLSGNVALSLYTPKNDYIKNYIKNDGDPLNDSDTLYFMGNKFESEGHVGAHMDLPSNLGFGLKFSPSQKISIFSAFDYTFWSSLKRVPLDLGGKDPVGEELSDDTLIFEWKNTFKFSFGTEYILNNFFALRAGFYYDMSPVNESTIDPLVPDAGNKFSFNLGSGIFFKKININLNSEYIYSPKKKISGLKDVDGDGEFDNFPGEYLINIFVFGIDISYKF